MTQTDLPLFGCLRYNKFAEALRQVEEMERLLSETAVEKIMTRKVVTAMVYDALEDAIAIARDAWFFSARYTTGWTTLASVPVEEVVFFLVIPICSLLTFEVVTRLLPSRAAAREEAEREHA